MHPNTELSLPPSAIEFPLVILLLALTSSSSGVDCVVLFCLVLRLQSCCSGRQFGQLSFVREYQMRHGASSLSKPNYLGATLCCIRDILAELLLILRLRFQVCMPQGLCLGCSSTTCGIAQLSSLVLRSRDIIYQLRP